MISTADPCSHCMGLAVESYCAFDGLEALKIQFRILIVNGAMGQQASDFALVQVAAEEHARTPSGLRPRVLTGRRAAEQRGDAIPCDLCFSPRAWLPICTSALSRSCCVSKKGEGRG